MRRLDDPATWGKGFVGESLIASWLRLKGYTILPAYEKVIDDWKGPRILLPDGKLVAPDMFALITKNNITYGMWVEAKTKSHFSWYRKKDAWQTGIDEAYFNDYIQLQRVHTLPVYLMFLHLNPVPHARDVQWGCPPVCPTGLFTGRLDVLINSAQSGRGFTDRAGRYRSMVYWNECDLTRYATASQIENAATVAA